MSGGSVDLEMPAPSPWPMGVVMVGAGVTLWWLMSDMLRRKEESSRAVWGDSSSFERWPSGIEAYREVSWRTASTFMTLAGLVVLVVAFARA